MNKNLITKIGLVAAGVLTPILLACIYFATKFGSGTGYDTFEYVPHLGDLGATFTQAVIYIAPMLMLITGLLLLVSAVLTLLAQLNVIKSEKLAKVLRVVNMVLAIVLTVLAVFAFIFMLVEKLTPGVGLYFLLLTGALAIVCAVLDRAWSKK